MSMARATSGPKTFIEVNARMNVSRDTSLSEKDWMSKAEASVRGMAKDDLYLQLSTIPVNSTMTYIQWVQAHPTYEAGLKEAIDTHTQMEQPKWNKGQSAVSVYSKLELKYLFDAVKSAEQDIADKNKSPSPPEKKVETPKSSPTVTPTKDTKTTTPVLTPQK